MIPYSTLYSLYQKRDWLESGWDDELPSALEQLPEPVQYLLAKLYRYSKRPLPRWRLLSSSLLVKLEWERTELCRNPHLSTSNLATLVEQLEWKSSCTPVGLLWRMTRSSKRCIQEEALKGWDACLMAGKADLEEARKALLVLLDSCHEDIVFQTILEFNKPHYYIVPPPLKKLKSLLDGPKRLALEALKATRKEAPKSLWIEILETSQDPSMRLEALRLWGEVAFEEDLESVFRYTEEDPLLYGETLLELLLQLRRKGIDLTAVSMERVLELLSLGFSSDCLVELVCGRWEQWLAALGQLKPDSTLWPTLLDTLKAAGHRVCTDYLVELLKSRSVPQCLSQVIEALTELGVKEAEPLVLDLASEYPKASLEYMEQLGGDASLNFLSEKLASSRCPVARSTLLETYLRMGGDATSIDQFCTLADWSREVLKLAELETIPLQTLKEVAQVSGHSGSLLAVRLLGRRGAVKILRSLLAGDDEVRVREAENALRNVGKRWFSMGRRQPQILAQVCSAMEAEEAFLADHMMIEINKGLPLHITRRLFERLSHLRHPAQRQFLLRWRQHADPEIRKYVLQCQALNQTEPHAQWILGRLKSKDIRDVRWALKALCSLGQTWCSPQVAECLKHPNMNVKKTAADALQRVGNREVLPQILHYLSFHQNPGLRDSLEKALRAIVGSQASALLLGVSEKEDDEARPREVQPSLEGFELKTPESREQVLRRLFVAIPRWKPEECFKLIKPIREILAGQQASFSFCLRILKRCHALPTLGEAQLAWSSQDEELRQWALSRLLHKATFGDWLRYLQSCQPTEASGSFVCANSSVARSHLVKFGLKRGWFESICKLAMDSPRSWIRELRVTWEALYDYGPETESLVGAWRKTDGLTKAELANWLGGESRAHQRCHTSEKRVHSLLYSSSPGTRQYAAELLLHWGGERNRRAVVDRLLENRLPARGLSLRLNASELHQLLQNVSTLEWNHQVKYLIENSTAPPRDQVRALLAFKSPENLECPDYRYAFQGYSTELVLSELRDKLAAKDWRLLCLVPPRCQVPREMIVQLASTDRETAHIYLRSLEDWGCKTGLLSGPGLLEALLQLLKDDFEPTLTLEILVRLRLWSQPEHSEQLIGILSEVRSSKLGDKVARALFQRAIWRLPAPKRFALRWEFERSPELVTEATKAYIYDPDLLTLLPNSLQQLVLRESLECVAARDEEVAVSALKTVMLHQPVKVEQSLKTALAHPSSRVRFCAHRYLKKRLPKRAFFELSVEMLRDPQPSMRKRAIKILSHGRYQPALKKIVDLLWDKKRKVDRTARRGLVRYGKAAIPLLKKKAARIRPDRRKKVYAIIQEICEVDA